MEALMEQTTARCVEAGIPLDEALYHFKRFYLKAVLARNRGNLTRTARVIGHHRNTLGRLLEELKLRPFAQSLRAGKRRKPKPEPARVALSSTQRLDQSRVA